MTKTLTQVPEGYKSLAGNLPPFVMLDIGEFIHGQIYRHRATKSTEKVRVKGKDGKMKTEDIEKTKHYLDITLVEGGEYNVGSAKKPSMRKFEKGETITLNLISGLYYPLVRELFALDGKPSDFWPKEDEADEVFESLKWDNLNGRKMFVRREADGKVKEGPFAGNKRNAYTVALSPIE